MKNSFKNIIRLGILTFGFLILYSCQKEEPIEVEKLKQEFSVTSPFSVTTIESSEIQSNSTLINKLSNLNSKLALHSKTAKNKNKYSVKYNFTVNTDISKYIESADGSYHSYTFMVNSLEDNGLTKNLIVSLEPDGSYKMVLVSYNLTAVDRQNLQRGNIDGLLENTTITLIEDDELASAIFSKGGIDDTSSTSTTNNLCIEFTRPVSSCSYGIKTHPGGYTDASGGVEECDGFEVNVVTTNYCTGGRQTVALLPLTMMV